jgi:hypothetical protein
VWQFPYFYPLSVVCIPPCKQKTEILFVKVYNYYYAFSGRFLPEKSFEKEKNFYYSLTFSSKTGYKAGYSDVISLICRIKAFIQ